MRVKSLLMVGGLLIGALSTGAVAGAVECAEGTFEVSGTVTDAVTGEPLYPTSVGFTRIDGTPVDDQGTGEDGTYAICLPPARYKASFFADEYVIGWYDGVFDADSATSISVSNSAVSGIDGALHPLPVISGRVTDLRSGVGVQTSVGINDAATGAGLDGEGTDADGNFSYTVPQEYLPGAFKIAFVADSYRAEWFDDARRFSRATVITVAFDSGEITGVDAELRPCGRPIPCIPGNFSR